MVTFGENVYLWRVFKGLAQGELAKKAGIPRPNLSAIESGKRDVTLTTLRLLAAALGITPGILVNGIGPLNFKGVRFSRTALENIALASIGKAARLSPQEKNIAVFLSGIIRNRINAEGKKYNNTLKKPQSYVANWLMFKDALGKETLSNLLSRAAKHIRLSGEYPNESKTD